MKPLLCFVSMIVLAVDARAGEKVEPPEANGSISALLRLRDKLPVGPAPVALEVSFKKGNLLFTRRIVENVPQTVRFTQHVVEKVPATEVIEVFVDGRKEQRTRTIF